MAAIAVVLALVVGGSGVATTTLDVEAERVARAPCRGERFVTDGVGAAVERRHAANVIRCAFWHVLGGQRERAVEVARCESGLDDEASNGGRYLGLFQHAAAYWPGRARALPDRVAGPSPHAFHARANAWAAARLVRSSGWEPWSCA
jgi:hypothetical protein